MGLAASQVRMLSLTSRKASIERDILQSSNRKIALSREMNNLANEYYDALSAEKLMYLSDTGEYTNLSYQYLMGKPGGIEDIDVKSDNSMLLIDTLTGKVVLSSEMANKIGFFQNQLAADSENIYLAISKLCGDVNITPTVEGGIISPNLIKDICAGKYDTFDANDLANAINNPDYYMWTTSSHIEGYDVEHVVPSNLINEVPVDEIQGQINAIDEDYCLGFASAYENDELIDIDPIRSYSSLDAAKNAIKNYAREIAVNYYNVNDYSQLTLKQKINVAKVMKHFNISSTLSSNPNRNSDLLQRDNYAYVYQTLTEGTNYEAYFDPKLFINALYTAEHLSNEVYDFTEDPRNNVYTHYNGLSGDSDPAINIGQWKDGDSQGYLVDYISTLGQLFRLSEADNYLVQISGPDGTDNSQTAITNFVNALMEHSYSNVDGDAASELESIKNNVINHFTSNMHPVYAIEVMTYSQNTGNLQSDAPACFSNNVINWNNFYGDNDSLSADDEDVKRLATYVVQDTNNNYFTYIDASALITYFNAMILGENIGYGYDNDGNFKFLSPMTDPETQPEQGYVSASNTTKGAYTPYLNVEKITKLLNNMNATKDEVFASNVTVTHHQTEVVGGAGPNEGKKFTPAGEIESQWIKNFKDLINDVKFYFTIVTACAKFGMTSDYDQNLKDSDYIDKNIQNGVFQLMGFDTKLFSLESAKDTDYYLLTSEFSKMNDPAQQAIITAWYEAEKAEINSKETYLDTQIENLSIELNSIKTEIESVKTLIDDAVKQTFDWGKG